MSGRGRSRSASKRNARDGACVTGCPAKRQKGGGGVKAARKPRTWEESRALLEAYRDAHDGCCSVPRTWKDDPQLGKWVSTQKVQFRKYEADPATSSLSAERVLALREMGAIDSWRERSLRTWEESRLRLEVYRDTHDGCCNVPQKWKDDLQLGKWVDNQKVQFRKYEEDPATSTLSAERFSALEQMGAIKSWIKFSESSASSPKKIYLSDSDMEES